MIMQRLPWKQECKVLVASPIKIRRACPIIKEEFDKSSRKGVGDDSDFYRATRNNNVEAAQRLIQKTLDKLYLTRIRLFIASLQIENGLPPILIAPLREGSKNVLSKKTAYEIGKILNLEVDGQIFEISKGFSRKSQSGLGKLLNLPSFGGNVQPSRSYIAVDDIIRSGGTIAELRSYVEINGGHFIGSCALASVSGQDHVLNNCPDQLDNVRQSLPIDMLKWFENKVGSPIGSLTASETYILSSDKVKDEISLAM
jgi:hypothetical protein